MSEQSDRKGEGSGVAAAILVVLILGIVFLGGLSFYAYKVRATRIVSVERALAEQAKAEAVMIALKTAEEAQAEVKQIFLDVEGNIRWEDQIVDSEQLHELLESNRNITVVVHVAPDCPFSQVEKVTGICKSLDVKKMQVQVTRGGE